MARIQYNPIEKLFLQKRFRGRAAAIFLAVYFIVILFTSGESQVVLPQEEAPLYIYSNQAGDDLRITVKQAIDNAATSIHIAAYSITDEVLISSLRKKALEGVHITVYTDKEASPHDLSYRLGPQVTVVRKTKKGLMHHKIISIDHRSLWLGSTNLTRDSMVKHGNILVGIHSQELARFAEAKIEELSGQQPLHAASATLPCMDQDVTLSFLPYDHEALNNLANMIDSAKKTVRVAMYTFTHKKLIDALARAHQKGIDVEVVFDKDSAKQTSHLAFEKLKKAGVKIFINKRPGLLHYKMMIVDGVSLIAGSANWTLSAFTINDDNLLHIHPLNREQRDKVETLWENIISDAIREQQLTHEV